MVTESNGVRPIFGGALWYYQLDAIGVSAAISAIRDEGQAHLPDVTLTKYRQQEPDDYRFTRPRALTEARVGEIVDVAAAGRSELVYLEGERLRGARELPPPTVWLRLVPDDGQQDQRSLYAYSMVLTFSHLNPGTPLPGFGGFLAAVARRLGSLYALAFASVDSNERNCELQPMQFGFTWEYDEKGHPPPFRVANDDRLSLLETHRPRLGTDVRGAYWANYFGPDIVQRVGGVAALASLEADRFGAFDDGAVTIQLTDHLRPVDDPVLAPRLAALGRVLAPVTVPHTYPAPPAVERGTT